MLEVHLMRSIGQFDSDKQSYTTERPICATGLFLRLLPVLDTESHITNIKRNLTGKNHFN